MVSEKGRGLALRRRAAKRRAYGEEHTPCGIATLLAATWRSEGGCPIFPFAFFLVIFFIISH